eukprot:CAMPEP_0185736358 /NCGR_PEP_ID=MMETSP1171-20130828/27626_1 /TAXON_ID=374046 /ORGANISM="Helicotheca tamensis, Strain CCMP826" /LENGTH=288 /DNA_ID=CAMNT_0028406939 /DNA_START=29 /DNA_END=895 /DNA_ORIENTATION=+
MVVPQQSPSDTNPSNIPPATAPSAAGAAPTSATAAGTAATPASHTPSLAGSVIEASDGLGGTTLIRIQNMSSTANLGVRLDLKQIALRCRNTEFNPRRFGAVIMRLREPRATALIFASGKMCVTGTKSAHNSSLAAKKFAYIIERVGFKPQSYIDFKVQNIVGTADVGFPIRLEGLVYAHSKHSSYEPELFPGLIYRLQKPRVVFLIFVSGKIVITGAKTEMDLSEALRKVYPLLVEYKKANVVGVPGMAGGMLQYQQGRLPAGGGKGAGGGKAITQGGEADANMEEV